MDKHILCIDLKSFFASVECVIRGLDPFSTPLVVASKRKDSNGAITLAVTPYLKKQGLPSRIRLYEIPKNIHYFIVPPQMKLYVQKSKEVISIYADFISLDDIHIYSIDECFLDVTNYLKFYQMSDIKLAQKILQTIKEKTSLTATCGIGPNLFLAKVAMDTEAKKNTSGIAKWSYDDVPTKLWSITPLSKIWGIGPRMEKRLNDLNIYSLKDLALYDPQKLKEKFGVFGLELHNHALGIDNSEIKDFKKVAKEKSISESQVLFRDYYAPDIYLIIREMTENLCRRLRTNNYMTKTIYLKITYSKTYSSSFSHHITLDTPTDYPVLIYHNLKLIFDKYYENLPIRKVGIAFSSLTSNNYQQLDIFHNPIDKEKDTNLLKTIDNIKNTFGKNSILKASSLLECSTAKERNHMIGGHHE